MEMANQTLVITQTDHKQALQMNLNKALLWLVDTTLLEYLKEKQLVICIILYLDQVTRLWKHSVISIVSWEL